MSPGGTKNKQTNKQQTREDRVTQLMEARRLSFAKTPFLVIFHCRPKKIQMAANRTILIPEGQPMANLKAYVPNFQKHMWKRS